MAKETVSYCEGRLKKLRHRCNEGWISTLQENETTIGGIPKRFLDLSHFSTLNHGSVKNKSMTDLSCLDTAHVIADENHQMNNSSYHGGNAFSSDLSQSFENPFQKNLDASSTTSNNNNKKLPSNRITVHSAPLPHVNGTYIQEGVYEGSPLYVRVGPPRKFMGFDCCVVLRREMVVVGNDITNVVDDVVGDVVGDENPPVGSSGGNRSSNIAEAKTWKIGLVPSHTITHPRLIGYYEGLETMEGEPPVEGWKVPGSVKKVGGLRILYEE